MNSKTTLPLPSLASTAPETDPPRGQGGEGGSSGLTPSLVDNGIHAGEAKSGPPTPGHQQCMSLESMKVRETNSQEKSKVIPRYKLFNSSRLFFSLSTSHTINKVIFGRFVSTGIKIW